MRKDKFVTKNEPWLVAWALDPSVVQKMSSPSLLEGLDYGTTPEYAAYRAALEVVGEKFWCLVFSMIHVVPHKAGSKSGDPKAETGRKKNGKMTSSEIGFLAKGVSLQKARKTQTNSQGTNVLIIQRAEGQT